METKKAAEVSVWVFYVARIHGFGLLMWSRISRVFTTVADAGMSAWYSPLTFMSKWDTVNNAFIVLLYALFAKSCTDACA